MINLLSQLVKTIFCETVLTIRCFFLWFYNLVLRRRLKVSHVYLREPHVLEGSPIQLAWISSGCHRIEIDGGGIVPGNKTGAQFAIRNLSQPIRITFYGFNTVMEESISVRGDRLDSRQIAKPSLKLPICSGFDASTNEIMKASVSCDLTASGTSRHIQIPEILVTHQPFDLDKYLPKENLQ